MSRVLVLLAVCLLGVPSAGADEADEQAGRSRLAALRSRDAKRRRVALGAVATHPPTRGADVARTVRAVGDVLRRREPAEQALAVTAMAALPGAEARMLWLEALDPEKPPAVFRAAVAGAARHRTDGAAAKVLLAAARTADSEAGRALALEALGVLGGPGARALLLRAPTGRPEGWLEASGRALGLGHLGGEEALEALLDLLAHPHAAPRVHAWEALVALTGAALPAEVAPWRAWRLEHPGPPLPRAVPSPADAHVYAESAPRHVPRYYGVPIDRRRSRVVFCLDVSQSMWGRGIEQARRELRRTLEAFPSTYAFDIIAFNERLHPFAGALTPSHPVVKASALAWLDALETISYTNLYDAVATAFGYVGPGARLDAVFLLSDGAPNRGRYRAEDEVVRHIEGLAGGRVPVHTVAAGEEVFPLLRRIAEATGGRFVDAFDFE